MASGGKCFVVAPMEGRRIDLGDFEMLVKADNETTDGVVSVLEATEPPGFGPPVHVHGDAAEAFYVLEGEYFMDLDGEEHHCPAGSFTHSGELLHVQRAAGIEPLVEPQDEKRVGVSSKPLPSRSASPDPDDAEAAIRSVANPEEPRLAGAEGLDWVGGHRWAR
jgi:mannose-6-phosphate isomerase-like protein (cupin superfamily)